MINVGIFFLRPNLGGGTTTFVAHLYRALEAAGHSPTVYRVGERDSRRKIFGSYDDVFTETVSFDTALKLVRSQPCVIGCVANVKYLVRPDLIPVLMGSGLRAVIHDPSELSCYSEVKKMSRPILVRHAMVERTSGLWIPLPYERHGPASGVKRTKEAVSIARFCSEKRPRIILEANRLLAERSRVLFRGAEFRLYSYGIQKRYGDVFQQSGKTHQVPRSFDGPVRELATARFNVDMSYHAEDGGGMQYSQLEAMDAETVNIMHEDWFRYSGELKPGKHVVTVNGHESLARLLKSKIDETERLRIASRCVKLLRDHAPLTVGEQYAAELLR